MGADARAWLAEHPSELIGLPAALAVAAVAKAGLRPRAVRPGAIVTAEYRPDRVSLRVDDSDVVVAAVAG